MGSRGELRYFIWVCIIDRFKVLLLLPLYSGMSLELRYACKIYFYFSLNIDQRSPEKDPTELNIQDRKNIFEQKRGPALVPKVPFGQCLSEKVSLQTL